MHANAALVELVHGGRTPTTTHFFAGAANEHTTAVAAADANGYFFDAGENDNTISFVEDTRGQALVP